MSAAAPWDPAQYLRFGEERARPALDLIARLPEPNHLPAAGSRARVEIVDLGCGAGNITGLLKRRYPAAAVTGVDGSAAMLAEARRAAPDCLFAATDISAWAPVSPPDLIFSNAALQWLDNHEALFPRLLGLLMPGGWLAVQMPAMHEAPVRRAQIAVAATGPWSGRLAGVVSARPILETAAYLDLLRPFVARLDVWETTYWHALQGADAVAEWAAGSSLRPYLVALEEPERSAFRAAYAAALRPLYPPRPDGTTLLPFRRLFLLAQRPPGTD
jgi:trans-aconitate 2-methyltransferase